MGLIGLIVTLIIVGLGMSYFYFGMGPTSLTIENDTPTPAGLDLYEDLKEQATDIKETEEERVEAEIASLEENLKPESLIQPKVADPARSATPSVAGGEMEVEKEVDIVDRLMSTGFAVPAKARTIDTIVLHSSYNSLGGDPYSSRRSSPSMRAMVSVLITSSTGVAPYTGWLQTRISPITLGRARCPMVARM